jgi:molecular chaperone DnaK (HSP70)
VPILKDSMKTYCIKLSILPALSCKTLAFVRKISLQYVLSRIVRPLIYDLTRFQIILSGGSSRIPKIQELVSQFFDMDPLQAVNPDLSNARGAAINARSRLRSFSGINLCTLPVEPELRSSLGIKTAGGFMTPIIRQPEMFPAFRSHVYVVACYPLDATEGRPNHLASSFTTVHDNQTTALIEIYGGENSVAADNIFLGQFELTGLPPAPRGVQQIQLFFKVLATDEVFELYFRADSDSRYVSL